MLLNTEVSRITLTDDLSNTEKESGVLCEIQDGGCGCCVGITRIHNDEEGRKDLADIIQRLEEALSTLKQIQIELK